jgi:hypothetical protein
MKTDFILIMQLLQIAAALFVVPDNTSKVVATFKEPGELNKIQFNVTTERGENSSTNNITTAFAVSSTIQVERKPLQCLSRLSSGKTNVIACDADATACQYLEIVNWGVVAIIQRCTLQCNNATSNNNAACMNNTWYYTEYGKIQRACCCDYDLCNDGNDPDPSRPVIPVPPEEPMNEGGLKCYGNYNDTTEIVTCAGDMRACFYYEAREFSGNETILQTCVPSCSFKLYNRCFDWNISLTNGIVKNMNACCCDSNLCNDGSTPQQIWEPPPPSLEIYVQVSDCRDGM